MLHRGLQLAVPVGSVVSDLLDHDGWRLHVVNVDLGTARSSLLEGGHWLDRELICRVELIVIDANLAEPFSRRLKFETIVANLRCQPAHFL